MNCGGWGESRKQFCTGLQGLSNPVLRLSLYNNNTSQLDEVIYYVNSFDTDYTNIYLQT